MAADRILVWYLEGILGTGLDQGPAFYMDADYTPTALRIMAKRAPDAGRLSFDIKDDGVSILSRRAGLAKGDVLEDDAEEFPLNPRTIEEGSLVTLDVTSMGASGITIQLELTAD